MRTAAWILAAGAVLALACGGAAPEGTATPAPPDATATPAAPAAPPSPTPEPTPLPPATEPVTGQISITSPPLTCDQPFTLTGSGFEPGRVAIYRPVQFEEPELLLEVQTGPAGGFDVDLVPQDFSNCNPGWSYGFIAGPAGARPNTPESWPFAVYDVEQLGAFSLSASSINCGTGPNPVSLDGDGFPPQAEVTVRQGGAHPLSDNFVVLGAFQADTAGDLKAEIEILSPPCGNADASPGQGAIFGHVEGLAARWKAVYDIVP